MLFLKNSGLCFEELPAGGAALRAQRQPFHRAVFLCSSSSLTKKIVWATLFYLRSLLKHAKTCKCRRSESLGFHGVRRKYTRGPISTQNNRDWEELTFYVHISVHMLKYQFPPGSCLCNFRTNFSAFAACCSFSCHSTSHQHYVIYFYYIIMETPRPISLW